MNFKEQTGIVTNNISFIGKFVGYCFEVRNKAHIAHLKSNRYSEHIALCAFYNQIIVLVDIIAEAYQGKYGLIEVSTTNNLGYAGIDVIKAFRKWLTENRNDICVDTNIQNEIDNVLTLCDTTIYKLQFLK